MTRKRASGRRLARKLKPAPVPSHAPLQEELPVVWLSQDRFAALVGLSDRQCRQLAHDGKIPLGPDGRFDAIRASLALANYYRAGMSESDAKRLAKARADKEESKAKRERIMADLDEGRSINMDSARQLFARAATATKVRLRSIPSAAAPKLLGLSVTDIEIKLRAEIDDALRQLDRCRLAEDQEQ